MRQWISDNTEEIGTVIVIATMVTMVVWWLVWGLSLWQLALIVPAYIGAAFYEADGTPAFLAAGFYGRRRR